MTSQVPPDQEPTSTIGAVANLWSERFDQLGMTVDDCSESCASSVRVHCENRRSSRSGHGTVFGSVPPVRGRAVHSSIGRIWFGWNRWRSVVMRSRLVVRSFNWEMHHGSRVGVAIEMYFPFTRLPDSIVISGQSIVGRFLATSSQHPNRCDHRDWRTRAVSEDAQPRLP